MNERRQPARTSGASFGGTYLLAGIGALVWFWQQADGFWGHVVAVLKALVWPAYLVYQAFKALAG